MKKIIAMLLSLAMCFALVPVLTAESSADAPMTAAEKEARIANLLEYTGKLHEMSTKYTPANAKKNADDPFANARIIVKSSKELDYTGSVAYVNGYEDLHVIQYSTPAEAKKAMEYYNSLSYVKYAEPDAIAQICATPGDYEYVSWGWGEDYVNAQDYNDWILTQVGSIDELPEIIVAVIDTGADSDHPMIADRLVPGHDFENNDTNPEDDHGHGTHVSGTIIDGTYANIKVMPLKVLDADGYGDEAIIASAMEYAALNGCAVANMSLSGPCTEPKHERYEEAVELGKQNNCVFCVAAGNNNIYADQRCPANVEDCITVASYSQGYVFSDFSNMGSCVDLTAPGGDIRSARMGGGYVAMSGTSMATPHVAAVCGMIKTVNPDISVEEITSIVKGNVTGPVFNGGGVGCLSATNILKFYGLSTGSTNVNFDSPSDHAWTNEGSYVASGNAGFDSTTSTLTGRTETDAYQILSFEYKVSSQQSCDELVFSLNGEEKLRVSGNQDWQTFTCVIPGHGETTFTWDYIKDASGASGDDKAYIRNVAVTESISSIFNSDGCNYEFISEGSYPWVVDGDAIKSGNAGVNNSVSTMTASVTLPAGVSIVFNYNVDAASGDNFTFKVNGQTIVNTNSTNGFVECNYQVPAAGTYALEFAFTKDGSGASGSDCVWAKDFFIGHTMNSALNVEGGTLDFTSPTQTYPWEVENTYLKSGNAGHASTTSRFELTIELEAGDTISFDYKVSSEANYDKFIFSIGNSPALDRSGSIDWTTYTYTAVTSNTYTFKWEYTKDGSVDRDDDAAYVDNVQIIRANPEPSGDVDGDGAVTAQDALLTMRYALSLIPASSLNTSEADIDGDGEVTIQDATVIMRNALGL